MNIHNSFKVPGEEKIFWAGNAFQNLDDMVSNVNYQLHRAGTQGIYVCMSSQRVAVPVEVNGRPSVKAQRSSLGAVEHKSLFIDIDVKEGAYKSQEEALTAFNDFMQVVGLPPPTAAISTGSGGFHVHWILKTPMKPDEWKKYAFALSSAITQHGLIADTQCTVDAARIFRIPDTFNLKSGEKKPVKFICGMIPSDYDNQIIYNVLEPYVGKTQGPAAGQLPTAFNGVQPLTAPTPINAMSAGVTREARPVILQDVAKECAFIHDAFQTGGATYDNALWNLTTLIATFSEDGRDMAHDMAKGHKTYTVQETDALYTRKMSERVNNNIGWPQCKTIAGSGCIACQSCSHFGAGKSPLHFGRTSNAPANSTTDLPTGYFRDANNLIYMSKVMEDGSSIATLVSPYPIWGGWIQTNPYTLFFTTKPNVDKETQVRVLFEDLDAKDKMASGLRSQGLLVHGVMAKLLGDFLVSWSQELKKIRSLVVDTNPFGWVVSNGKDEGFAYGGKVYTPTGEKTAANASPGIDIQYKPRGDIQPWLTAAKLITDQQRPELDLILAAAFAGPLMRYTGQPGALISAYSTESGIGKTSAMKVAQSVWGDPVRAMQSLDDTNASVLNKIGELRSIPIFWDELKTSDDAEKFVKLAFSVTGGKEKSRMTAQIEQRHVGTWETMLMVASNDTLVDYISAALKSSEAGVMRLFEYVVTPGTTGQIGFGTAGQIIHETHDNFGRAGEKYAEFIGRSHVQVKADIKKCLNDLEKALNGKAEERFWFCCAATLITGAFYANGLGLTNIGLPGLTKLCRKIITDMRALRNQLHSNIKNSSSVWDTLTQFLSAMSSRHTLVTDTMPIGPGKPPKSKVLRDSTRLEAVYVHIAMETGVIRISRTALMQWLVDHGYGRHLFTQELETQFGFKNLNSARLGGGTQYATGNQYLLEGMFAGTPLADWISSMGGDIKSEGDQNGKGETIETAIENSRFGPSPNAP